MGPYKVSTGGGQSGGKKRKHGGKNSGEQPAPRPNQVKRDKQFYRAKKFIKNNYVVKKKETVESSGGESSEEEVNSYNQLLQTYSRDLNEDKTVTSDSDSDSSEQQEDAQIIQENESQEGEEEESESGSDQEDSDSNQSEDEENENESESEIIVETEDIHTLELFKDEVAVGDAYQPHIEIHLSEEMLKIAKEAKFSSKTETYPCMGKLQVLTLPVPESMMDNTDHNLHYKLMQDFPTVPQNSLNHLYMKATIKNNIDLAEIDMSPLTLEMLTLMSSYKDLMYTERTFQNGEDIRLAYTCHAINHVLKAKTKILKNNAKMNEKIKKKQQPDDDLRDQGLSRTKVLFILPFRESARRVISMMEKILFTNGKGNIEKKERFAKEFPEMEPRTGYKPDDFYQTFAGDTDDSFMLGMQFTRKNLKLYTNFLFSDIIIASPLGLRLIIGNEGDQTRNYDFLNSIEMLIMDQNEIFMMQNWEHVLCLLDDIHKQPREAHGTDFNRVRHWSLDALNKYYRQTLLFSSTQFPKLNSIFNSHCFNYFGKVRGVNPIVSGAISTVFSEVPLVFQRVDSVTPKQSLDDRFEVFKKFITEKFMDDNMDHVLIFFSDYVDFVKCRNWFKAANYDYAEISEYTSDYKMGKARDDFYHNGVHFVLYTERAHFFRRFAIKGIRHLVFYQIPLHVNLFCELCNLQQNQFQNKRGGHKSNMSCTVFYTKYDASRLVQCVGTDKAATMIKSNSHKHIFSPS